MRRTGSVIVVIALALAGCAALELAGVRPLRFEEADDRDSRIRILAPSSGSPLGGASFRLWARIDNPNGFGVILTEVAGDLLLEDADAIEVRFPLGLPLVARQDTIVPLDVTVGFDDLPGLARSIGTLATGGAVDYTLDGTFAVDAGRLGEPRFGPLTLLRGELRVR